MLTYNKKSDHQYEVLALTGRHFGEIARVEDGYFYYFPQPDNHGFWPAHLLREIADKLDEMNAPWEKELNDYFRNGPTKE